MPLALLLVLQRFNQILCDEYLFVPDGLRDVLPQDGAPAG